MRNRLRWTKVLTLICVILGMAITTVSQRRSRQRNSICGNPQVACKTTATFKANDLPFQIPANAVIWDSELFYAVILKSVRAEQEDCNTFISEEERLQTQALFPTKKVFTDRCYDIENMNYTNVDPNYRFMAVYGGTTFAEAQRTLAAVKATGKFSTPYIKRMRTGFNGT